MKYRTIATGLTVAALALFEGYRQIDYHDPVGIPTACFGSTANAAVGTVRSIEECEQLLIADVRKYQAIVLKHASVPLNNHQLAALTSFVYNVGEGAFASSTLLKKLNAGDYTGACNELPRWVYAKGIKLNGLVKRRQQERALCLKPEGSGLASYSAPVGACLAGEPLPNPGGLFACRQAPTARYTTTPRRAA